MMISTRHSLFVFGALLAAFALLGPASALAQEDVRIRSAEPPTFDKLRVTWSSANADAAAEGYRVYYRKSEDGTLVASATNHSGYVDVDKRSTEEVTLTGLTHNSYYRAAVAWMDEDGVVSETPVASADDAGTGAMAKTEVAPPPAPPRDVTATGGDMTFMVEWVEPYAGGTGLTIKEYRVQKRELAGSLAGDWVPDEDNDDNDKMGGLKVDADMTMVTFDGLENGITYQARVRAVNSAGVEGEWSIPDGDMADPGDEAATVGGMTETPALPLLGILGLGAGLVAAGRRRLRRRQQLLAR